MRVILFLLFSLAIGKVATQHYIQKQAAENAIINAYREHALVACQKFSVPPPGTRTPVKIKLVIGRPDLNVRLWQTSHSKWSARYQDPVLVITSQNASRPSVCEYDINSGTVQARALVEKKPQQWIGAG